jgi:tetratricopeptide (TPR) repeat protein
MPILRLSSEDAQRNLKYRSARWPDGRISNDRFGDVAEVAMEPRFRISREDKVFTMGSCFAREIEQRLAEMGFDVPMMAIQMTPEERGLSGRNANSIVNKYTVHSIANEMTWALDEPGIHRNSGGEEVPLEKLLLDLNGDAWVDPHLKGSRYAGAFDSVANRRARIEQATRELASCRVIVITLGLVEAWFDHDTRLYLNGRPPPDTLSKYPSRFELHVLGYDDILEQLERIYGLLKEKGRPEFRMLVTVSPVPLAATFRGEDALCANTYSKSVQRAAVEAFRLSHDNVDYFPSYEIVTLTERRRAYWTDNIHVRPDIVSTIMERVVRGYAPEAEILPSERVAQLSEKQSQPSYSSHRMLAEAMLKSKEFDKAVVCYAGLLALYGDTAPLNEKARDRLAFARSLFACNDRARGRRQLDLLLQGPPDDVALLFQIGRELTKRGRLGDALTVFAKCEAAGQVPDELYDEMARIYELMGRSDRGARKPEPVA